MYEKELESGKTEDKHLIIFQPCGAEMMDTKLDQNMPSKLLALEAGCTSN